jgi:hypothetical protein
VHTSGSRLRKNHASSKFEKLPQVIFNIYDHHQSKIQKRLLLLLCTQSIRYSRQCDWPQQLTEQATLLVPAPGCALFAGLRCSPAAHSRSTHSYTSLQLCRAAPAFGGRLQPPNTPHVQACLLSVGLTGALEYSVGSGRLRVARRARRSSTGVLLLCPFWTDAGGGIEAGPSTLSSSRGHRSGTCRNEQQQ